MIAILATGLGFSLLSLLLWAYMGCTAYTVARQSREIGICMALGAQAGEVVQLFIHEVLALVIAGVSSVAPRGCPHPHRQRATLRSGAA